MMASYPFFGGQVEILDLAVFEKGGKADAVVGNVRLLSNHHNVVQPPLRVELLYFLTF